MFLCFYISEKSLSKTCSTEVFVLLRYCRGLEWAWPVAQMQGEMCIKVEWGKLFERLEEEEEEERDNIKMDLREVGCGMELAQDHVQWKVLVVQKIY